jgi:hypothetical protein
MPATQNDYGDEDDGVHVYDEEHQDRNMRTSAKKGGPRPFDFTPNMETPYGGGN